MAVLAIRSLRKSFIFGPSQAARRNDSLSGVDMDVDAGEIVGIVGNQGVGKTTLLLCAAGLMRADAGSIHWYGQRFHGGGILPSLAYLPAAPTYYPFLTVRDVFACYSAPNGDPCTRKGRAVALVAASLGLSDQLSSRVGMLPLETLRRVAVAQALLEAPRVMLVDGSLDALGSGAYLVHRALREFARAGGTVIATSRHPGALSPLATRIVVMDAGRLTGSFSASGLVRSIYAESTLGLRQIAERMH